MSEAEKFIDNTKKTYEQRKRSDAEMMQAVLKFERPGWSKQSERCMQYCHANGFGFVLNVRGEWQWIADRNGAPRQQGACTLLEMAMLEVSNRINM